MYFFGWNFLCVNVCAFGICVISTCQSGSDTAFSGSLRKELEQALYTHALSDSTTILFYIPTDIIELPRSNLHGTSGLDSVWYVKIPTGCTPVLFRKSSSGGYSATLEVFRDTSGDSIHIRYLKIHAAEELVITGEIFLTLSSKGDTLLRFAGDMHESCGALNSVHHTYLEYSGRIVSLSARSAFHDTIETNNADGRTTSCIRLRGIDIVITSDGFGYTRIPSGNKLLVPDKGLGNNACDSTAISRAITVIDSLLEGRKFVLPDPQKRIRLYKTAIECNNDTESTGVLDF